MTIKGKLYKRFREIGYTQSMSLFLANELSKASKALGDKISPVIVTTNKLGKLKQEVSAWKPLENLFL
jgi:hypothetical protein